MEQRVAIAASLCGSLQRSVFRFWFVDDAVLVLGSRFCVLALAATWPRCTCAVFVGGGLSVQNAGLVHTKFSKKLKGGRSKTELHISGPVCSLAIFGFPAHLTDLSRHHGTCPATLAVGIDVHAVCISF
jgi:hypothetical protein